MNEGEGNPDAGPVATSESGAAPGVRERRVIRRVVCAYELGTLPREWLQTWRLLQRTVADAHWAVSASLAPLAAVPAGTDILVVPPELRDVARTAVPPGTPILVTTAPSAGGAFADLVSRLESGPDFTADRDWT